MQNKDILKKVEEYVMPLIQENNFELVEVEFVKEGANYYLRLYVDKEGGFSIQDCQLVSRFIEAKLEEDDFIEKAYILEVSSPGIDRILKKDYEYSKYKGKLVDIKLYKPIDIENNDNTSNTSSNNNSNKNNKNNKNKNKNSKLKEIQGTLVGLVDNNIIIMVDDKESNKEMSFDRKDVATCRLAVVF